MPNGSPQDSVFTKRMVCLTFARSRHQSVYGDWALITGTPVSPIRTYQRPHHEAEWTVASTDGSPAFARVTRHPGKARSLDRVIFLALFKHPLGVRRRIFLEQN
jgi:hypothetical protein